MTTKSNKANQAILESVDTAQQVEIRQSDVKLSDVLIDEEFLNFLDHVEDEDGMTLLDEILRDGFRDKIVVWKGRLILIDGHRRLEIWKKYYASDPMRGPAIVELDFPDREAVKTWMIANQMSRRNLTDARKAELALNHKSRFAEQAKLNRERGVRLNSDEGERPVDTMAALGKKAGMGRDNMFKVQKVKQHGTPELKSAMKKEEISIHKAAKLAGLPSDEQNHALEQERNRKSTGTTLESSEKQNGSAKKTFLPKGNAPENSATPVSYQCMQVTAFARGLLSNIRHQNSLSLYKSADIALLHDARDYINEIVELLDTYVAESPDSSRIT